MTRTPFTVPRDSHGRIARSAEAKHAFEVSTGYPHGRPGYVVDHIIPLARGGADLPSNMQWQTIAEGKAKDRGELGQGPRTVTGFYTSTTVVHGRAVTYIGNVPDPSRMTIPPILTK